MKFKERLKKLFEEYLSTLNDVDEEEHYATDRGMADTIFENFMKWLEKRNP